MLATGFVLFTLLVNGMTLRPLSSSCCLDRLSKVDQAVRDRAIMLSLDAHPAAHLGGGRSRPHRAGGDGAHLRGIRAAHIGRAPHGRRRRDR